jgi:hypothetical protein
MPLYGSTRTPGGSTSTSAQRMRKQSLLNYMNLIRQQAAARTGATATTGLANAIPNNFVDPASLASSRQPTNTTTNPNNFVVNAYNTVAGGGTGGLGQAGSAVTGSVAGDGMAKRHGFASNYAGVGDSILYDNPEILVRDTLKGMGYSPDSGLSDLLGKDAGQLQYLLMLANGAQPGSLNSQDTEDYINYANKWAKSMVTPGGAVPDTQAMLQEILDAPEGSALKAMLTNGTPQEQAQALNTLVQVAASGLTPLMQKALAGRLQDRTTDWLSTQAKGGKSPLADYLQQGGMGYLG